MALRQGWAVNSVSIDAPDARLAMAGLVVRDTSHVVRSGVFGTKVRSIVTARADMKVDVAFFNAVFSRGAAYGAVLLSNDGTVQVTIDTAPTANSRIDVVYVMVPDTAEGNTAGSPSFQVAKGTAAASPQKPSVPVGGFELATVQVPSTATSTSSANVIITQTHKFTSVMGGRIPFRSLPDIQAETLLPEGTLAYLDDPTTPRTYRFNGSSWRLWAQERTPMVLDAVGTPVARWGDGAINFLVTVREGIVRVDFRARASTGNLLWGNLRYALPYPPFDVWGVSTTDNGGAGQAVVRDNDTSVKYGVWVGIDNSTTPGSFVIYRTGDNTARLGFWGDGSAPFPLSTGDTVVGWLEYPAA